MCLYWSIVKLLAPCKGSSQRPHSCATSMLFMSVMKFITWNKSTHEDNVVDFPAKAATIPTQGWTNIYTQISTVYECRSCMALISTSLHNFSTVCEQLAFSLNLQKLKVSHCVGFNFYCYWSHSCPHYSLGVALQSV